MHFFLLERGSLGKTEKRGMVCVSALLYIIPLLYVCAQLRKSVLLAHDDIVTNRMHFIQVLQIRVGFQLIQRP